ncbi:hypothetical protein AG0111_0g6797 [Alternaria gaisen]|uniref:Uncharacterized protein n=1 Tax=Alternaria gaisen TaxID=167740 RepID=A0ACB6FLF7_9PLEO|nr:hypothetical protein AG0111_0g6797 [Alternaria gaisen]
MQFFIAILASYVPGLHPNFPFHCEAHYKTTNTKCAAPTNSSTLNAVPKPLTPTQ